MKNILQAPNESLAESTWNVAAVNQILRNTDLGDDLQLAGKVLDDFNVSPGNQTIGDYLVNMPVPLTKETIVSFKWLIINKETCEYIDQMRKPYESEGFTLVQKDVEQPTRGPNNGLEGISLDIDVNQLTQAWVMLKDTTIAANEIEKRPYEHEVIR